MGKIRLQLQKKAILGEVKLSGSKSISNRLLLMAHLANADTRFENLSDSDDTDKIKKYLHDIEICSASRIPLIVDAGNAGTVFRFLAAYLAMKNGKWLLTGDKRMKHRPIEGLVNALRDIGAEISYSKKEGFPPLQINGGDLIGNKVKADASKSSQFVTALMLIAPYLEEGLEIELLNNPVSFAYIQMTKNLMNQFGARVKSDGRTIFVQPGNYDIKDIFIEPDWSSASYWYEFAALADEAEIFLSGFKKESIQGDRICETLFKKLGVITKFEKNGMRLKSSALVDEKFEFDFSDYPDLVPAIMATCAVKKVFATFNGVGHLKYKESDRLKSLSNELKKVGAKFKFAEDSISLIPSKTTPVARPLVFDTYADHRIAMCLAPMVLKYDHLIVNDPRVVSKSYPDFWKDIKHLDFADVEEN